jgi:dTDP-glucose 4,6-dehydratase
LQRETGTSEKLITFVADRLGHDARYAIDATKLMTELGWAPEQDFEMAIRDTVKWYIEHSEWVDNVTSGEYLHYYEKQYSVR